MIEVENVTRVLAASTLNSFFLILSPSSSFIFEFHQSYMKILELSSGCASYLPCFLDSSWLGLTESREFPHTNRDYMWWVLSNSQWTKVISHATSILGEPVTWNAVLLPSVDPFSNFEGMDRFKSHVLQFWMATMSEWSQRSKIRYWYAEEIWEA